jgi:hypothetical protein
MLLLNKDRRLPRPLRPEWAGRAWRTFLTALRRGLSVAAA